jgi:tripartite-type tricarboxylate transporter receptor subunit TctC
MAKRFFVSASPSALRRTLLGVAMLTAGMMAFPGAQAQSAFPNKPVTLLVPFPPGSATDAIGRALAVVVSKSIGQQVIVENRAGAAGTLAAGSLAQSNNPDGYTIAIAPASLFRIPHLQKVGYDPIKDLTYIMNFSGYTFSLVVPESSAWKTLPEFIDYAKANPGKVSVGASGTGSSGHVATVVLSQKSGAELTFVPFKGGSEVLAAFVGEAFEKIAHEGVRELFEGLAETWLKGRSTASKKA